MLELTVRQLDTFDRRADLRRHRRALADTGIAGTAIHYVFFWFTARWLAKRFPGCLTIDWPEFESVKDLDTGKVAEVQRPLANIYSSDAE